MQRVNGDQAIAEEMLDMLMTTLPNDWGLIQKAYQNQNTADLYDILHRFYGGLCYTGTPRLNAAAYQLKMAALEADQVQIDKYYPTLSQEITAFTEAYKKLKQ